MRTSDRDPRSNREPLELYEVNYLETDLAVSVPKPLLLYMHSEMRQSNRSGIGLCEFSVMRVVYKM